MRPPCRSISRRAREWKYSNTGYILLGALVRKVSGSFYGDVLRDRVFTPLGMTTARVISEAEIVPNRAAGYRLERGELRNQQWVAPSLNTTADGSLYLSLQDLIAWDRGIRTGAVLQPESWRQILTPSRSTAAACTRTGSASKSIALPDRPFSVTAERGKGSGPTLRDTAVTTSR